MLVRIDGAARVAQKTVRLVAPLLVLVWVVPAVAVAKTVKVPVKMDWRIGHYGKSTCASYGLATWPAQEDAVGWELRDHFTPTDPAYTRDETKQLSPPFDDEKFVKDFGWRPAKGTHWYALSYSGRSHLGGDSVDCSDLPAKQKAAYSNVRILITLATNAKIVGRVKDRDGDPVQGVKVRAKGAGGDRTDADGKYSIDVPEKKATYVVVPHQKGSKFKPQKRKVTVKPGRTSHANFRVTPTPDGLDWRVPPRLAGEVKRWTASEGLPTFTQVHPAKWRATMFLTRGGAALGSCPAGKWKWRVKTPRGARVVHKPKPGCKTSMAVSRLGTYKVSARNRKQHMSVHGTVKVKDWLITGFGDSNGSGEGNPPFRFEQCDRSEASYQLQAAQYVESHDPRSSVTFIFPACSGAIIEHLYKFSYAGIDPGGSEPLDPQIKQAARLIDSPLLPSERRKVDAAIVSIGVNNLGFGPLLQFCISRYLHFGDPCEHNPVKTTFTPEGGIDSFEYSSAPGVPSLKTELDSLVAALPAKYGPLARALSSPLDARHGGKLGVKPSHVLLTQYPDFTRDSSGQLCSGTIGPQSTWGFVESEAAGLNAAVAGAAAAHGWKAVTLPQSVFTGPPTGHGYCASDAYFVPITGAATVWNLAGGFHPTGTGHTITALATIERLCKVLYGNPKCDGKP